MHTAKETNRILKRLNNKDEYQKWLLEESDLKPTERDTQLMELGITVILALVCLGTVLILTLSRGA